RGRVPVRCRTGGRDLAASVLDPGNDAQAGSGPRGRLPAPVSRTQRTTFTHTPLGAAMLRVAVPNKGALSESASEMLAEAGYRRRPEGSKDLSLIDRENDVEFFFLRPKDIAVYVGSGRLELGITGRDLSADSMADVEELLELGFGRSTFRYAGPAGDGWSTDRLAGARIATSYPNIVRRDLR